MLNITLKGLNGQLGLALAMANLGYMRSIADMRDSNQLTEKYAGVGQAPSLEEFKGEHHYSELGEDTLEVVNKVFTGGIEVPKRTILYDKTGDIRQRMSDLATSVQDHRDERILDVLKNGATAKYKCYDGKKLFATDHKTRDSGVQSNDLTHDVTAPTAPTPLELGNAILFAIRSMLAIKNDRGKKTNKGARQFLVVVPLNMLEASQAVLNNDVLQGASGTLDNTFRKQRKFQIDIEPEGDWDDDDAIIVARTDGPKPVILQELSGLETHMHGPGTEFWDVKKAMRYGVEVSTGVAPFFWQSANRVVLLN